MCDDVLNKDGDISPCVVVQFVTDAVSVERILGKGGEVGRPQPVEYCVVCGDKASGKNKYKFTRTTYILLQVYLHQ